MYLKITIILILGLSRFTNAFFFGLFSSKPTPEPDVIVSESPEAESDKLAYENYLRYIVAAYPPSTSVQYVPIYIAQPQFSYTDYVQQPFNNFYPTANAYNMQQKPASVRYEYTQPPYTSGVQFQRPITVLPSASLQQTLPNIPEATRNLDKLIEGSTSSIISKTKTINYEIPAPQMPTSLDSLPVSGIAVDFRTGGYVTKTMIDAPSDSNKHTGRKFSHAYTNGDGTKVSEEGHLVQYGEGQETIVKRGQYEYIDATGNPVLVKWIADDNGYRLVN